MKSCSQGERLFVEECPILLGVDSGGELKFEIGASGKFGSITVSGYVGF